MMLNMSYNQGINNNEREHVIDVPSSHTSNKLIDRYAIQINEQVTDLANNSLLDELTKLRVIKAIVKNTQKLVNKELEGNIGIDNQEHLAYNGIAVPFPVTLSGKKDIGILGGAEDMGSHEKVLPSKKEMGNFFGVTQPFFGVKLTFGMLFGMIMASLKVAFDCVLAPLLFLALGDIVTGLVAEIYKDERTRYTSLKNLWMYFIMFFMLTWLMVFEKVVLAYEKVLWVPLIYILQHHCFVMGFFVVSIGISLRNILMNLKKMGFPVKDVLYPEFGDIFSQC